MRINEYADSLTSFAAASSADLVKWRILEATAPKIPMPQMTADIQTLNVH